MPAVHDTCTACIYDQLHDRLRNFVARRVSDPAEIEDIVQDVFLRIHTHLDHIRSAESLEAWVFTMARNSVIDSYRRNSRTRGLTEFPVADDHHELSAAEELAPSLREAIESLPERYRQALMLTEYEGLSQSDLAARLGISLSGAKSRVQRARQKVRDVLLACCHVGFDRRGQICCFRACCPCCGQANLTVY